MKNAMDNVLLLSAGRRVELAQAFIDEINTRDKNAKLFAVDLRPELSAACQNADEWFAAPRVTNPSYIDFLLSTCRAQQIGLVVPTIDTELLVLAKHRETFAAEGIHLVISDESFVRVCRDKRQTSDLFTSIGISTPDIYARDNIHFPCFAKPFDGSCSIGALSIYCEGDLTEAILADEKMMFMELIGSDFSEYTVDAYFNRCGELCCLVPRYRIEVRSGEVNKGVTRRDHVYDYLLSKLRNLKGARGCITLQLFANNETGQFSALEINPRFGGGFPLSYSAGANYPGWLMDEYLLDKEVSFFEGWETDLLMLRYDAKVLVHGVA
jgi:carbamoyl-phosphate synthase large subunit